MQELVSDDGSISAAQSSMSPENGKDSRGATSVGEGSGGLSTAQGVATGYSAGEVVASGDDNSSYCYALGCSDYYVFVYSGSYSSYQQELQGLSKLM